MLSLRWTAIHIVSSDVDLSLDGHRVRATPWSLAAIRVGRNDRRISNVAIRNGSLRGAAFGLKVSNVANLCVENLDVSANAVGMDVEANHATFHRCRISRIGGLPLSLSNAYAVGIVASGRHITIEDNRIEEIYRQRLPARLTGEGVGILIRDDCQDYVIRGNEIRNRHRRTGTIGIWDVGSGSVLSQNTISNFADSIVSVPT